MIVKKNFYLFIFFAISNLAHCKTYKRCELIKELIEKHNFMDEHAAKVSCIAEGALFDMNRITYHPEKDENQFVDGSSTHPNYGIFQISSEYWCSETEVGGICNMNCKDLIDDDVTDDIRCLKKIVPNLDGDDWNDPWSYLIGSSFDCAWKELLQLCTDNADKQETNWKSLDDCLSHFPVFASQPKRKDFNGIPELQHIFPHAAAIGWSRPDSNETEWSCSGSLISEDTVMTAAHCTFNRENREPDVVRLGDLNLETEDDEKGTQQFEVFSIIRHPDYKLRYNDIALIKLKSKVQLTFYFAPACLWARHDFPRDINLEAFGQTLYKGDMSSVLIQTNLVTITTDSCQAFYEEDDGHLTEGILDEVHLCAVDKMGHRDTLEEDSGGPLEMKLHYVAKLVPFVVGVTSFGRANGSQKPRAYTRVSSYIDWIKEHVPDLEVDTLECSKKYMELRLTNTRYFNDEIEPQKMVLGDTLGQTTSATVISDRFLLAAASNLKNISNPNRIQLWTNSSQISIEKIFYHPNHVKGAPENDIALIKLKSRIRWRNMDHPTCVSQKNIKDTGHFSQQETYNLVYNGYLAKYDQFHGVQIKSDPNYCLAPKDQTNFVLQNYTDSFICFKSDKYHIPDFCDVPYGSPVTLQYFSRVPKQILIIGLAVQSLDCTFTLAINISKHYEWINSVVFGSLETETE